MRGEGGRESTTHLCRTAKDIVVIIASTECMQDHPIS